MSPHRYVGAEALLDLPLKLSAELGRARMVASRVVGLPTGAIVELDREPDEPVDLFVNGRRFGSGRLLAVDGEWAVRIESIDEGVEHLSIDATDAPPDAE